MPKPRNNTRREEVRELREQGLSYYKIAQKTGIAESLVRYYLRDIDNRKKVSRKVNESNGS